MLRRTGFHKYHLNVAAIFSILLVVIVGLLAIHINPIGSNSVTGFSVQESDFNTLENVTINPLFMGQALIVLALLFTIILAQIKAKKSDTAI